VAQWHPDAERDAADVVDYYDAQRAGLGALFLTALFSTEATVDAAPAASAIVFPPDVRRAIVQRPFGAYGVYYRMAQAGQVTIVAVLQMQRDPGWIRQVATGR